METDLFSYPTPFTPPTTEEDELPVLRLIRSRRVGPTTFHRLIGEHGSAAAALAALPEVARAAGVADYTPCPEKQARAEIKTGKAAGARLLIHGGPGYPAALAEIDDAPPVLWALGQLELLTRPMIALVGARNASSLGLRMAKRLSEGLGEAGICVVSGLARGIDAAAHEAALPTGTIAVQAGGIDVIYPQENMALAQQMAETGLRLTEAPPGTQPQARHFPARNRIISGLSAGVVVVEAALKSGSLITARDALDQGREVMAVPGHPMDGRAGGCNALIRDGATLVRGSEDVLAALNARAAPPEPRPAPNPPPTRRAVKSADLGAKILERLGPSPTAEDQVIRDLDLPAAAFSQALTALEIEGRIERHRGGLISRPL
ncbi:MULTISPECIES: DNA-processing protein DprA [Thioclava]|uniref:DNA-processing protein DprA n=1 Tax=Thioclava TaxID=285107 RepID=UPI000C46428E|nr:MULTISPECIES: DNA-processing protein DprA [Thioclava]MAQ35822.1 DNA-protecting protein DprA [Thioclava sp.]|tara:strand:- start:683 stop:1813 length:1131 start_codon:yes stop_codon:yes gene_type:complete